MSTYKEGDSSPIIQPAATIMLLRDHPKNGVESLLLRRNDSLKFAPGFWVFPGGKVELSEINKTSSLQEAASVAAARETMEETGIHVSIEHLSHYVHWTTPEGGNRRYGTWFFYAWVDTDDVVIDQSEIVEHRWLTPELAFDQMRQGYLKMLPPTFVSLYRISPFQNRKEIDKELTSGIPRVVPKTTFKKGIFYSFYEGDVAYESLQHELEGPRHRIVGNFNTGEYSFQYEGCEDVFPVTGRSVLNTIK